MIEHDAWWPGVSRGLARDLDVHLLAANAGAGLVDDGPPDWPPLDTPAGWAAWYAAGDELR